MPLCRFLILLCLASPLQITAAERTAADPGSDLPEMELIKISIDDYRDLNEEARDHFRDGEYDQAFEKLSTAARWGDKLSQFLLAVSYLQGLGTDIDNVVGTAWLTVAAESENRRWEDFLRQVESAISAQESAAANELAQRLIGFYGMRAMDVNCRRIGSASSRLRHVRCTKRPGISGHRVKVPKNFPL